MPAIAVRASPARRLIAPQQIQSAGVLKFAEPAPHPRRQRRIVDQRRDVHAQIDLAAGQRGHRLSRRTPHHEGALADPAFDQAAFAGFRVGAADRRVVDAQSAGHGSLRWQAGAVGEFA